MAGYLRRLTSHFQVGHLDLGRKGGDLAEVGARVGLAHVADVQPPVVGVSEERDKERGNEEKGESYDAVSEVTQISRGRRKRNSAAVNLSSRYVDVLCTCLCN